MRSPRHWLKKHYGEWRIDTRRQELEREMSRELGKPVILAPFGDGGNDSIYLASSGTDNVAVVRLHNPFKKNFLRWPWFTRGQSTKGKNPLKGLNREWEAYRELAASGVTPRPVWRTGDATAVGHIPGIRMNRFLRQRSADAWQVAAQAAFNSLARIHELNRAHYDAKIANVIFDPSAGKAYFIDLDRMTGKDRPLAFHQTFDYLKLLSSFLQVAPSGIREDGGFWLRAVGPHLPGPLKEVDVAPMLVDRTTRHLARCRPAREALAPVFRGIAPDPTPDRNGT